MDPKHLSDLPLVFQIIAGAGLFFGTFMLAIGGWLWKTIKPKLPSSLQPATEAPVAIPISSAQILDTTTFDKLSRSMSALTDYLREKDDDVERELERGFGHLERAMEELLKETVRTTKAIERVEKAIQDRTLL